MKSMKVDAVELQGSIDTIDNMIDSFDDVELSLFSKVMSLKDIWNDGYTSSFYESMENEKHDFDVMIQDLESFNNVYKLVHKRVSKYGDRIQADLNYSHNISIRHNSCNQKFYNK